MYTRLGSNFELNQRFKTKSAYGLRGFGVEGSCSGQIGKLFLRKPPLNICRKAVSDFDFNEWFKT